MGVSCRSNPQSFNGSVSLSCIYLHGWEDAIVGKTGTCELEKQTTRRDETEAIEVSVDGVVYGRFRLDALEHRDADLLSSR